MASAMELSLLNPAATHRHRGGLAGLPLARRSVVRFRVSASAAATAPPKSSGPKKRGKTEIQETLLTPRFYTTDFDEMERLFNAEINKQLNQAEFDALLQEFKTDYNQTHFVRNPEFKAAADKMEGPHRQIFVEFLERSCTAEFSGFLLYKELGRRLKVPSCFFALPCLVWSISSTIWWACADTLLFFCRKLTRSWRRSSRSCPGTRRAMLGTNLISFHAIQ
jgi:magnesium-protoporphyrin IX monomethyl ester (oxidative) cyclase